MISHDHRFIFTHVPKTAGKSIRNLFGLPEFERDYVPDVSRVEQGYGHNRLVDLRGEKFFSTYFKFAFVRNPFDRIVSAYCYLDSGGCNEADAQFRRDHLAIYGGSFRAFVEDLATLVDAQHFRPQTVWLSDERGRLLTDFVGRCETLQSGVAHLRAQLGLALPEIPHLNRSTHLPYQSYYDEATRRRVAEAYGEDIELFSYRFEEI